MAKNLRGPNETLADYIPRLAATPLVFHRVRGSCTAPARHSTLWAHRGDCLQPAARPVLAERVFDQLEMMDTRFCSTEAQMPRLITAYTKGANGLEKNQRQITMSSKVYFSGGGGLVSTSDDYARFAQMLANGGVLGGKPLLSPRTVKLMASAHVPSTLPSRTGEDCGLSVRVMQDVVAEITACPTARSGGPAPTGRTSGSIRKRGLSRF